MQDLKEFKLIDGLFTAEEATQVLTALINYKIDYHNREDFSNHIRFNKNPEHSNKRIAQLVESKDLLQSLLNKAIDGKLNFKIDGTIKITVEA
ncbi:hypothetical protein [Flavobacterium sp.]|uniref:hypothetical protein n=1 Tax=Flavobacterium sp. TaxID=239 RepID=UPI0026348EE7|nr:hypothetical protein [Flavobacterium sp.]MDG2431620.1 hypothetical protein [Flavobacterium sp.]